MSSINILFFIDGLERGGTELRLLDFAKHFPPDIIIHLCVTNENLALLENFKAYGVHIVVVPIRKSYLSIGKIYSIMRYIKHNHITVINAFELKGLMIAISIRAVVGFNLKIVYHSVNSVIMFTNIQLAIFARLLRFCQGFICNSGFSKNELRKLFPGKMIRVIHNGVDSAVFRRNHHKRHMSRSDLNIGKEEIVLGIVANFRRQKNYPFLLKAFEMLSTKNENLKLLCVGGGENLEKTKKMALRQNLHGKVIFTGYSEHVIGYLNAIDILVLPSLWEGFPNAILQAMSMEIPVVASNVGGCPEIINNMRNGILFPSNNLDKFTEAVEMLSDDSDLTSRLGDNARKTVEKNFSLSRMIESYTAFYRELSQNTIYTKVLT